eukprot:snap_masked-scaffold_12-processed-gene-7.22-mRNA-1 protein AED:1.00 eAED:1.00 QI:0/-1/0/0/-1/1/1/0/177
MFKTLNALFSGNPAFTSGNNLGLTVIFHQIPQPWHPQSSIVHEAALAVKKLSPGDYIEFCGRLFEKQVEFFDINAWNKTRSDLIEYFVNLSNLSVEQEKEMKRLMGENLKEKEKGAKNYASNISSDLKQVIKFHRSRGVHVSPTVYINGLEAKEVSSGWSQDQWLELFGKLGFEAKI